MDLEINNLACRRAGRQVFLGLSFHLKGSEAAILRGPNGVGKSTLLRVLAGLLPAAQGAVRLGSHDLTLDKAEFQEQLAYAGHLDAVKPALSIRDNLGLWSIVNGAPKPRLDEALERFGLGRIADRMAAECSAGQKRRLGLARLLVSNKPLWLLDEPTVSLDREAKSLIADLIQEHVAKGGLALIATHEDLGLGDVKALDMQRSRMPSTETEADPFLEGAW